MNFVSESPQTSRISRHQVAGGYVTTQRHARLRMDDDAAKALLPKVDGCRTVAQIAIAACLSIDEVNKHLGQMAGHGLLVR